MQNLAVLSWNFAWMRELIQKMVSQPGKMPLYFWICNLPSFPNPPPLCPMRCTQRTRGCLAITSPAGPLGNGKATEKEQSKAPRHPRSSCGIKSCSFPRAGNLPHLQSCRKDSNWEAVKLQCGNQGQEEVLLCKGMVTSQQETRVCDPWPCLGYSAVTRRNKALEKSQNIRKFLGIGMRESKGNGSLFSLQEAEGRQSSNCQLWKL